MINYSKRIPILFLFSLASCDVSDGLDYSESDTMNVINEYNKNDFKGEPLELASHYLYYADKQNVYDGKIHVVDLGCALNKRVQHEEARMLFYELIDGLIEKINDTEYLRKYFSHYPIGYEDLFVRLSFDYDSKGHLRKGDVFQVNICDNEVTFHILEENDPIRPNYKEIKKDIFILEGFLSKTRNISEIPPPYTNKKNL